MKTVWVLSGGADFYRNKSLRGFVTQGLKQGRQVTHVGVGEDDALRTILSSGFLVDDQVLVVVESGAVQKGRTGSGWSEESFARLEALAKETGDASVVVVVHHVGEPTASSLAGRLSTVLPKTQVKNFVSPKPWEEKPDAVKFLLAELRQRSKGMSEAVAEQVVNRVGTDLGLLSFEALKVSVFLDAVGRSDATASDVGSLMAAFGSDDYDSLKVCVGNRNVRGVVRVLSSLRKGPGGDSPARAIAVLGTSVTQWLHAAHLHESGVSVSEQAQRCHIHEYRYVNFVLPHAVRWGSRDLTRFLRSLSTVDVRRGHVCPWVALESIVLQACDRGSVESPR